MFRRLFLILFFVVAMEYLAFADEPSSFSNFRVESKNGKYFTVKGRPFGSPLARGMTTGKYCIKPRAKPVASDAVNGRWDVLMIN